LIWHWQIFCTISLYCQGTNKSSVLFRYIVSALTNIMYLSRYIVSALINLLYFFVTFSRHWQICTFHCLGTDKSCVLFRYIVSSLTNLLYYFVTLSRHWYILILYLCRRWQIFCTFSLHCLGTDKSSVLFRNIVSALTNLYFLIVSALTNLYFFIVSALTNLQYFFIILFRHWQILCTISLHYLGTDKSSVLLLVTLLRHWNIFCTCFVTLSRHWQIFCACLVTLSRH
jgi:hypothetical protein